jgi:hypothetical protein
MGVGDGAGAQAVADAEADVVGGHDVAEVVPVGVEEIFTTGDGAFPNPAARATCISGRQVLAQQRPRVPFAVTTAGTRLQAQLAVGALTNATFRGIIQRAGGAATRSRLSF